MRPSISRLSIPFLLLACGAPLAAQRVAQPVAEPIDDAAIQSLRKSGLDQSHVMELLSWITDVYGPRLTGSPNLRHAQDWAVQTFKEWGLANAHLENWGPFGRGWRLDHFDLEVVGDNPWQVLAWPKAWSPSMPGRVEAEVVRVDTLSAEQLDALDLKDKIVLVESPRKLSEPFEAEAKRLDAQELLALADGTRPERARPDAGARRAGRSAAAVRDGGARDATAPGAGTRDANAPNTGARDANAPSAGAPVDARRADVAAARGFARRGAMMAKVIAKQPLAILDRGSKGDYGTLFVQQAAARPSEQGATRAQPWDEEAQVIPQLTVAVEHYNRICRLLDKKIPVRLAIELKATFFEDQATQHNVVAEIAGTDAKIGDQVVMLGAHYDSWHSATGATDNGVGSAVMMEAMRLLQQLVTERGTGPRRTIRVALWSGEEQGLLGSHAYVREHFGGPGAVKPEHEKLSCYLNLDNGTGKIRGVHLQGNEAVAPIFRAWMRPFHDLGAATLTLSGTGGTDHLSFDRVGLPGFQFIQDPIIYNARTHHSNMDSWDHVVEEDLAQAATIVAACAWHAAQRDEMLPRTPMPEPGQGRAR